MTAPTAAATPDVEKSSKVPIIEKAIDFVKDIMKTSLRKDSTSKEQQQPQQQQHQPQQELVEQNQDEDASFCHEDEAPGNDLNTAAQDGSAAGKRINMQQEG